MQQVMFHLEIYFIGTGSSFDVIRQNLPAPTSGSFKLGNEGGLGFVTSKWTPPTVNSANHLDLKDFKIIRSSSATFASLASIIFFTLFSFVCLSFTYAFSVNIKCVIRLRFYGSTTFYEYRPFQVSF